MAATAPLLAHHSLAGVYDMKKTNPHGSVAVAVKNAEGTSTEWVMTLG
jgi:hypothetical protein